jgi:hypothetical protein
MLNAHGLRLELAFVIELSAISYGPSEHSPVPAPLISWLDRPPDSHT